MLWCHHRDKRNIRYLVECGDNGKPIRYAMGENAYGKMMHGYRLIAPAPKDCGPHMQVEFGIVDEERFREIYEMEV